MKRSLLLADDSLTIQKVVQITLSNYPFSVVNVESSEKLLSYLKEANPNLILLDFTLDTSMDGYDLCHRVNQLCPDSNIILLYGTFDEPDMEKIQKSGAKDYLVKPFDGEKFVQTCLNYTADTVESVDSLPISDLIEDERSNDGDSLDQWSVDEDEYRLPDPLGEASFDSGLQESSLHEEISSADLNSLDSLKQNEFDSELDKELEDWGMSVPDVIGEETQNNEFDNSEDDLDIVLGDENEVDDISLETKMHSGFLQEEDEDIEDLLDAELDDSLANLKIDVDEIENNQEHLSQILDDVKMDIKKPVEEAIISHIPGKESLDPSQTKTIVKEYLETEGKQIIERIAWEMMPDLAENIIRDEFKKAMGLIGKN